MAGSKSWPPFDLSLAPGDLSAPDGTAGNSAALGLETAPEAALPAHPSLRALVGALMAAGPAAAAAGWRQGQDCARILQRIGLEPVHVRLHGQGADVAWRDVCAISPLALDVVTVVVGRFQATGGEVLMVRAADVLDAKGCRRWGGERQALERQVGRELLRLGRISFGVAEQPLFQVTALDETSTRFVVALEAGVRSEWAAAPLCPVSPQLLQFDHRLNRGADVLAKKVGLYFSLAGAGSRPVARSVGAVLKGVGVLAELRQGRGGRLADRFEEAVLRLDERGVFAIGHNRAWQRSLLDERVKGWVSRWLAAELTVKPCD